MNKYILHFKTYNKAGGDAYLCRTEFSDPRKMTEKISEVNCNNCRTILGVLLK